MRETLTTVSIIMGVRCEKKDTSALQKAVKSILSQSFKEFEFLICDDGSSIEALTLMDEFALSDFRVRLVRPGNKLDLASKLNVCLRESRGRYIARMDDDDESLPDRLQKQIQCLEERPEFSFAGCNVFLKQNGVRCGEKSFPETPQIEDFYMTQPYIHPTLVFRREVFNTVGGYSESKHQFLCEDYDLLLRLYGNGYRGINVQEKLFEYTIPSTAKGNRTMAHRVNEVITRWERFRDLGKLPVALPYVIKPLAVGLLPERILAMIKHI